MGILPGSQNSADLPSRGISASDLVNNLVWWSGTHSLYKPQCEWPSDPKVSSLDQTALIETVKSLHLFTRQHEGRER